MTNDHVPIATGDSAGESTVRLGQRLRRARLTRSLTQGELAKNLFSISYISGVERGQIRPSLGALEKLAERLQVPVTELLADSDFDTRHVYSQAQHRDSTVERRREEVESSLRAVQILASQHNYEKAIALLQRLQSQQMTPRQAAKVQLSLAICYCEEGRAEEARRVAQDAIPAAEQAGERDLVAQLHLELGRAFALMESHALALEQYQQCLRAVQQQTIQDPAFHLRALLDIGTQYWAMAEYEQTIAVLLQAVEVAENVTRPEVLGDAYWSISQAMDAKGNHAEARTYSIRSIAAYREATNRRAIMAVYNRLGTAFARSGQVGEALTQLNRAECIAAAQQDLQAIAEVKRNLALVYLEEKHSDEAIQAVDEALSASEQLGDVVERARSLLALARVQEARTQTDEATLSFEQAIQLLQREDVMSMRPTLPAATQLREAYAQFSEYLERHGQSKRAFEMLKEAYKSTQRI